MAGLSLDESVELGALISDTEEIGEILGLGSVASDGSLYLGNDEHISHGDRVSNGVLARRLGDDLLEALEALLDPVLTPGDAVALEVLIDLLDDSQVLNGVDVASNDVDDLTDLGLDEGVLR